jgi:hypothetical protein
MSSENNLKVAFLSTFLCCYFIAIFALGLLGHMVEKNADAN